MSTNKAALYDKGPQVAVQGNFGDLEIVSVDTSRWEAKFRARTASGTFGPEFTTRLSMIRPLSDEDTGKFWKMLVDNLMRVLKEEGKYPSFVKGYEVTTGEDSTGDPALYVEILVSPQREYAAKTVDSWRNFLDLVHSRLLSLRLQRYPYVRVGEKSRRK
ncbi:MAG: hypothetical protein ABSA42_14355 [Terracidiphilus sp.]|jgi:hypothetical protein